MLRFMGWGTVDLSEQGGPKNIMVYHLSLKCPKIGVSPQLIDNNPDIILYRLYHIAG
jgi:hypothetical protein